MLSPELKNKVALLHSQGKNIVLVTGVFDVFHQEHLNFLQKAKQLGDFLLLGVESDARVKAMKGPDRPIHSQTTRKQVLEETRLPDEVFILPEQFSRPEDHRQLIAEIQPKFLAVSSHTKHLENKRKILEEFGGEVVIVHEHNPRISSTLLIQESKKTQ